MCKCGCDKCETVSTALTLNESKAPRTILSEGLKHHIDANRPLTDNFYSAGSKDYFDLIAEARSLYSRGILEFTNKRDIELLTETDQGYFGIYEGKKVPLDFPMLNEEVDSYYLDNAKEKLSNAYKILGKEKGQTRRGDKYLQVNYIPKSSPQTQRPEFVKVFYDNDNDLKGLDIPMLNEVEVGDIVKIDKAYGGGKGEVKDKKGSFVVVNGSSYHESDVKLIKEYSDEDSDPSEDDIAQAEFGMDYDQLGPNEKEWVRDEYENINNFNRANEGLTIKERINKILEAKFKGKTVDLNKPTRGDSKKFKVYVNSGKKNADGSIKVKKVNFGHGGTTAKKAGQKTMKIRKSNPKARAAFRARHKCDNPGPKTMARYWSCKKW
jgi:hypothetical protein